MTEENLFKKFYINQPKDFYISQMKTRGPRHLWFKKRQFTARCLVEKYWSGGVVLDLGCGNCVWNDGRFPTVGVDICENMLKYNASFLPSLYPLKSDLYNPLPLKDNSVDMIIITEVLEHFINYQFLIREIKRVLKEDGVVVGSVPYSKLPGIWGFVFPLWCLYKGIRDNDKYYLNKCGHRTSFSPETLKIAFKDFNLLEIRTIGLLTIFFVARKKRNEFT